MKTDNDFDGLHLHKVLGSAPNRTGRQYHTPNKKRYSLAKPKKKKTN